METNKVDGSLFIRSGDVSEPDAFDLAARRFHGKPKGWRWRHGHVLTEYPGYIMVGVFPCVDRDGRVEWPDEGCDPPLLITFQQIEQIKQREAE